MDEMPNACASSVSASVSTLPNTASGYRSDALSKIGPNIRQGPHQAAQKSTRTMSALPTTDSKFSPVSSTVAMESLLVSPGVPRWDTRQGMQPEGVAAHSRGYP